MIYKKTQPNIGYLFFYEKAKGVKYFKSLKGNEYEVLSMDASMVHFLRKSTGKIWKMDLKGVHQAYISLSNFKTKNFKEYVPRTHSPALGLLLHLGLLTKEG